MKNITIHSNQFSYNMAGWCTEKSSRVIEQLAYTIEIINENEKLDNETKNKLLGELTPAIGDACKMLAFSCGATWSTKDREIILKGGKFAIEELKVKYELIKESSDFKRIVELKAFIHESEELLHGPRDPNRTLFHELLERTRLKEAIIETIADELEEVTMGRNEWEGFQESAREKIELLKEDLKET